MRLNGANGIVVDVNSLAELRENTIMDNGGAIAFTPGGVPAPIANGIFVGGGSVATINGGVISRNLGSGIHVSASPFDPNLVPGTARIGLDSDAAIEITDNGRAGIFVGDDGSLATIDGRNIVFQDNAEGDLVGPIVDVAGP